MLEASGHWGKHPTSPQSVASGRDGTQQPLDNRPKTREFLDQLDLGKDELEAAPSASRRYVFWGVDSRGAALTDCSIPNSGSVGFLRLLTEPFRKVHHCGQALHRRIFDHRIGIRARKRLVDAFVEGFMGEIPLASAWWRVSRDWSALFVSMGAYFEL